MTRLVCLIVAPLFVLGVLAVAWLAAGAWDEEG